MSKPTIDPERVAELVALAETNGIAFAVEAAYGDGIEAGEEWALDVIARSFRKAGRA